MNVWIADRPVLEIFYPGGNQVVFHRAIYPHCCTFECLRATEHISLCRAGVICQRWSIRKTWEHARAAAKLARQVYGLPP